MDDFKYKKGDEIMSLIWFSIGALSSVVVIALISTIDNSITKLRTENIVLENKVDVKVRQVSLINEIHGERIKLIEEQLNELNNSKDKNSFSKVFKRGFK